MSEKLKNSLNLAAIQNIFCPLCQHKNHIMIKKIERTVSNPNIDQDNTFGFYRSIKSKYTYIFKCENCKIDIMIHTERTINKIGEHQED